ncbi:hypothetical protein ABH15_03965 [Methanoculleus taiwanensis]|uniref:Uncharacterized protein n=1 Tax=Methanoculleus taiwanensis TaxID=1550565 RepID=A0A498H5R5_9EURY|nr:hypothetical protein [Methanoculleus taiwanensis]RXE57268.1 hypothetical protein ABH15_03965 [Methanoculleus taiwanensis]
MAEITENIFRHLLRSDELPEAELIAACRTGSTDDERIGERLTALVRQGALAFDTAEAPDPCIYRIPSDPGIFSRLWLAYPNLRTELIKAPRVVDTIAQKRLFVTGDELRSEVSDLLRQSPLFFELSLKHPDIAGIIADWDRIVCEPGHTFEREMTKPGSDPLPAYKIHGFFAYCVFYECMTAENRDEWMKIRSSVQKSTPTLIAVLSLINRLR